MDFPDDLMHLVRADEPLGPLVWLGIGGPARYFAEPVEESDIERLVKAAFERQLPIRNSGRGQQPSYSRGGGRWLGHFALRRNDWPNVD